jgi:hypothetical protein
LRLAILNCRHEPAGRIRIATPICRGDSRAARGTLVSGGDHLARLQVRNYRSTWNPNASATRTGAAQIKCLKIAIVDLPCQVGAMATESARYNVNR